MKIKIPKRLTSLILAGALSTGLACTPDKKDGKENENEINDRIIVSTEDEVNIYEKPNIVDLPELTEEPEVFKEEMTDIEQEAIDNIELSYYVTAKENVNIRSEANKSSDKLGMLFKGQSLKLVNDLGNWCEVEYDGKTAFISKDYLELIESYYYPINEDIPVMDLDKDAHYYLRNIPFIEATAKVNIREEANTDCNILGKLSKGDRLSFVSDSIDGWYEVVYEDKTAYVYAEYANIIYDVATEVSDIVFMISRTPLYDIDTFEEIDRIPKRELVEVYAEDDEYYLVKYNGDYGFVEKKHTQSLGDNYVVIDISDQNLKVYVDDKVIIDTSIVTGKDSSPTYCGIFDVYKKERNVNWPEFGVTVKYGLAFNRGEWMHDASWRKKFGGEIYHEDGSHGCVNIPKNVMPDVYEIVEIGTPVLVKK